jgi:FAD synthase
MYIRYTLYTIVAVLVIILMIRFMKKGKKENFKSRNQLPMYEYKVTSKIIPGIQRASNMYDYPTANLEDAVQLPDGMYFAKTNFGDCIAFVNGKKMECHIKGINENLYGKTLTATNFEKRNTKVHQLFAK